MNRSLGCGYWSGDCSWSNWHRFFRCLGPLFLLYIDFENLGRSCYGGPVSLDHNVSWVTLLDPWASLSLSRLGCDSCGEIPLGISSREDSSSSQSRVLSSEGTEILASLDVGVRGSEFDFVLWGIAPAWSDELGAIGFEGRSSEL